MEARNLSPWAHAQAGERSNRSKAAAFVSAMADAKEYAASGKLPEAFASAADRLFGGPPPPAPPAAAAAPKPAPRGRGGAAGGEGAGAGGAKQRGGGGGGAGQGQRKAASKPAGKVSAGRALPNGRASEALHACWVHPIQAPAPCRGCFSALYLLRRAGLRGLARIE